MLRTGLLVFFAISAMVIVTVGNAADDLGLLHSLIPDGYEYSEAESCLGCHNQLAGWKGQTHLENAVGVKGVVDATGTAEAATDEITGLGWISSKHARSQDGASRNNYCAWCHAPSLAGVTDDPDKAKPLAKKADSPGMSCTGCHLPYPIYKTAGTRLGNYKPGSDPKDLANWIPRHIEDGKAANSQCLFCHGEPHNFAIGLHDNLQKAGTLRCIDCHMSVFNTIPTAGGGLDERHHNMEVTANGPGSCAECHSFSKKEFASKIAALMGNHNTKKHTLPTF